MSATLSAQVTIKEKVEIKPKSATSLSSTANLEIVLSWISYADEGEPHRPMQLRILDPGYNYHGFDPYTESASGNYTSQILGDEGTYYYGQTTYINSTASPGWYTIEALGDTLTVSHHYGDVSADIYINGEWNTTIVFSFRYNYGSIPDTRYTSVQKYYPIFGEADPCVPGTLQFSFDDNPNLQNGGLQHGNLTSFSTSILGSCVDTLLPYYKYELLGDSTTWGVLRDYYTNRTGTVLDSVNTNWILFDAWGKSPEVPQAVSIRVSSEDESILPDTVTFNVLPAKARAMAGKTPEVYSDTIHLALGDTTMFTMEVRSAEGTWVNVPDGWIPRYEISCQPDTTGFLYTPDSTHVGVVIDSYDKVIYNAASDTSIDSVEVLLFLSVDSSGTPTLSVKKERDYPMAGTNNRPVSKKGTDLKELSHRFGKRENIKTLSSYEGPCYGLTHLIITNNHTILLGETKYYHADTVKGKLQIKESKTPVTEGIPELQFTVERYLKNDATKHDGNRLGAYYEYRDSTGARFADTTKQVRLIGRYWSADSNYFVRLIASNGSLVDSIIIEVKKPDRLGIAHNTANNVFNTQYNLDSVIIFHAGTEGIPPQLLKGQIEEESSFRPSYNYEPFTDAIEIQGKDWLARMKNNPYWIDSTGIGYNTLPSNHSYLWRIGTQIQYPNSVQTIWDYYSAHPGYYPKELYSNIMSVWKDSLFRPERDTLIEHGIDVDSADQQAKIFANDSLPGYLRNNYKGGLQNKIAQTRISSSYGLLQLVYFYGVTNPVKYQYPENQSYLPEKLNEVDTSFIYAIKHLKSLFSHKKIKENSTASTGWKEGYNNTFKAILGQYNKRPKYVINVIGYSNNYLPIR